MYDLVIRNGTIVDGTGLPRYRADVAIQGNRIAAIGRTLPEKGKQEIDAPGQVVTPGFIDGHTHMDAQVFWDPIGSCSCWHGVTTVVMGNCGFTLAPGRVWGARSRLRRAATSANAKGAAPSRASAGAQGSPLNKRCIRPPRDSRARRRSSVTCQGHAPSSLLAPAAPGRPC